MVYTVKEIMERIPHRYPFLLIDRIVEVGDRTIRALKNVTINEGYFQGHWPGEPVMPGVLQLEALAQTGAVLLFHTLERDGKDTDIDVFFRSIDEAKFRRMVVPGDQLILSVEFIKERRGIYVMSGTATVDGEVVSEAQITAATRPRSLRTSEGHE